MSSIRKEKLSGGTFKHVEGELYHYPFSKKELKELEKDIINKSTSKKNEQNRVDPTGEKATSIMMNKRITHMKMVIQSIDEVYQSLPREKKELVKVLYWTRPKELTWDGVAKHLHISKRQAQRWRKSIVEHIAKKLGWK